MKLKATKTSLYNLVLEHYHDIPPMRQTEFSKALHSRSWWLRFDKHGSYCEVYFSAVCGKAMLSFTTEGVRNVWEIPIAELEKFNLLDKEAGKP